MFRLMLLAAVVVGLTSSPALAKRGPAATIKPLEHDGVRYAVPNDQGRRAYVQAWNIAGNKKTWEVDLFHVAIDPNLEEDVQWIFIASMTRNGDVLKFVDEHGRIFELDLKTRKVTEVKGSGK